MGIDAAWVDLRTLRRYRECRRCRCDCRRRRSRWNGGWWTIEEGCCWWLAKLRWYFRLGTRQGRGVVWLGFRELEMCYDSYQDRTVIDVIESGSAFTRDTGDPKIMSTPAPIMNCWIRMFTWRLGLLSLRRRHLRRLWLNNSHSHLKSWKDKLTRFLLSELPSSSKSATRDFPSGKIKDKTQSINCSQDWISKKSLPRILDLTFSFFLPFNLSTNPFPVSEAGEAERPVSEGSLREETSLLYGSPA